MNSSPAPAYDLDRFLLVPESTIEAALEELRAGCKESHWMWFVFPQLAGLGRSEMARRYAISSLAEAERFSTTRSSGHSCSFRDWRAVRTTAFPRGRFHGDPPAQDAVDDFLASAELVAVRKSCWLWKKVNAGWPVEVWIGDARSDNFVSAEGEIIPIDIRIGGVPIL